MAKKNNGTFKPLGDSDRQMHGDTALLVTGHPPADLELLQALLDEAGLSHLPVLRVPDSRCDDAIGDIASGTIEIVEGEASTLQRAIVMSGMAERDLHILMKIYRESGMPQATWAVVTPVSETWSLRQLLDELTRERESLREAVQDQESSS